MQVAHFIRRRGVLISRKSRELTRLVILVSRINAVSPGRPGDCLNFRLIKITGN